LRRRATIDIGDLRIASGVLLSVGAALAVVPHRAGLPCPLHALTGVPCPLCGMTTSVQATFHGDLGTALQANPAGVAAVAAAVLVLIRPPGRVCVRMFALCATIAALWIFELWRFAFL
jgi:hypothetical protein